MAAPWRPGGCVARSRSGISDCMIARRGRPSFTVTHGVQAGGAGFGVGQVGGDLVQAGEHVRASRSR
jgi:hypothetical protein